MRDFQFSELCKENLYRVPCILRNLKILNLFFLCFGEFLYELRSSVICLVFLINNHFLYISFNYGSFPGGSDCKESAHNVGDWVRSLSRNYSLEKGVATPLQYPCLESRMDRGAGGLQSLELQRVGHDSKWATNT